MMGELLNSHIDCTVESDGLNHCSSLALRDVRRMDNLEEVSLDGETMSAQLLVKIGEGNVRVKVCWSNMTGGTYMRMWASEMEGVR